MNETITPSPFVRKAFSRIGWAFCAILLITTALQALWILVPRLFWGENNWATDSSWGNWIGSFAPLSSEETNELDVLLKEFSSEETQTD